MHRQQEYGEGLCYLPSTFDLNGYIIKNKENLEFLLILVVAVEIDE